MSILKRKPLYERVILKLSGEALMGNSDFGIDPSVLLRMAEEIKSVIKLGVQVGADGGTISNVSVTSTNVEVYGGGRYEWVIEKVHPYLSGGVSVLSTELEAAQGFTSVSDDDTSFGLYLGAGVDLDVTDQVFIGVGARQSFAHEPTLFGVDGDGDFLQFFLRVGTSF